MGRYKRNRKPSIRHTVRAHKRKGKSVRKYNRGQGKSKSPNRSSRRYRIVKSSWQPSSSADSRRRKLLASIPKNMSEKKRLRKCAERLQRIALDKKVDKTTRMKANADYDYFVERIQKFQNPAFGPSEKAEYIKIMNKNWELGRHTTEVGSFEEAHRHAESAMREQGYVIDIGDVKHWLAGRYGIQPKYA